MREQEQVSVIADAGAAPDAWDIVEDRCQLEETIRNHQYIMYSNITAHSTRRCARAPPRSQAAPSEENAHRGAHVVSGARSAVTYAKSPRLLRQCNGHKDRRCLWLSSMQVHVHETTNPRRRIYTLYLQHHSSGACAVHCHGAAGPALREDASRAATMV